MESRVPKQFLNDLCNLPMNQSYKYAAKLFCIQIYAQTDILRDINAEWFVLAFVGGGVDSGGDQFNLLILLENTFAMFWGLHPPKLIDKNHV